MRRIRNGLRLVLQFGLSHNQTAKSLGVSRATAQNYVNPFQHLTLTYDQILAMDDDAINTIIYPEESFEPSATSRFPDFQVIYMELRKRCVIRKLLWGNYIRDNPNGLKYSQFCHHYHEWQKKVEHLYAFRTCWR